MLCVTFYFNSSSLGTWGASTSVRARRAEHGAGVAPGAQARLAQVQGGGTAPWRNILTHDFGAKGDSGSTT